ncbi:MAG: L,D-transpeptidase family protein [Armatimonadota bacterium]
MPLHSAVDPLTSRLQRLPMSVGENRTIDWPVGENWIEVGEREHVGFLHLQRANPAGFGPGMSILLPARHQVRRYFTDGLVLNLPELMLFHWRDGQLVDSYPISIGRVIDAGRWYSPVGRLQIAVKAVNPTWNAPNYAGGGKLLPGPDNPLGNRWLGLSRSGYGIHGTNDPATIGRLVSHGCIRLFPSHILKLFDQAWVGMPVMMTYETVTVGQQNGIVYLAIFPDVYNRGTNDQSRIRRVLAGFDLAQTLTDAELQQFINQADGIARPILGSNISVIVDGEKVDLPVGPTYRDGAILLPARSLAAVLGAKMRWEARTKTETLMRDTHEVAFSIRDGASMLALGALFVPVREAVEGLGGTVAFTGTEIVITTSPIPNSKAAMVEP